MVKFYPLFVVIHLPFVRTCYVRPDIIFYIGSVNVCMVCHISYRQNVTKSYTFQNSISFPLRKSQGNANKLVVFVFLGGFGVQ